VNDGSAMEKGREDQGVQRGQERGVRGVERATTAAAAAAVAAAASRPILCLVRS
jgi:hypothetical protein